ncbi:hypothetical protein [Halovenus marina]|uniref:hypothetical protein n=1 Tax=Halovenus marina TaxID=3396621 RepID=UPI003F571011
MSDFGFDISGVRAQLEALKEERRDWMDSKTMQVGTAVEYSIYLEFGTSKMDAKPFFRPALVEAQRDLESFVADNTGKSLRTIDSADELVETIAFALERRVKEIITEKGLIDTGALRASVQAVDSTAELKTRGDVASRADVDLDPADFEEEATA